MFDLVFLFTGLCAFALEQGAQYPAERLDVVLVDTTSHVGMLVVAQDQLQAATGALPPFRTFGTNDSHIGYPLDGRIVRVVNGSSGDITWSPSRNDPGCPEASDQSSYDWVVPFKQIAPGKGQVLAEMSHPSSTNPPPEVHAKVELEAGRLEVASFARTEPDADDDNGKVLLWEFNGGSNAGGFETALADVVELRQEDLTGTIVLQLETIDRKSSGLITLAPAGRDEILVEIFNQPEKVICCNNPDAFEVGDTDDHFCEMFDLLPTGHTCVAPEAIELCDEELADPDYPHRCSQFCMIGANSPQCPGGEGTNP